MKSYFAVKALIEKDGKFLIIKRSTEDKSFAGQWDLPGGAVENNEEPFEALSREVMEECGLKVDIIKPIRAWDFFKKEIDTKMIGITFLCKYVSGDVTLSDEHTEFEWIEPDAIDDYNSNDWIKKDIASIE